MNPTGYSLVPEIEKLIKSSQTIYISAHANADPDALCTILALREFISQRYPKKKLITNVEIAKPPNLHFLKGFENVTTDETVSCIAKHKPDLLIITDIGNPSVVARTNLTQFIEISKKTKTIIIEHHATKEWKFYDIYLNNILSSDVEEVYHIFIEQLGYKINKEIAEIILCGILLETNSFTWPNDKLKQTFDVVCKLKEAGAEIEDILNKSTIYTKYMIKMFQELFNNLVIKKGYSYSFISDKFTQDVLNANKVDTNELKHAMSHWIASYLKNIENNKAGFTVYRHSLEDTGTINNYYISFRSADPNFHIKDIAVKFGGGGHQFAAAALIKADKIENVIKTVINTIKNLQTNK